MYTNRVTVEAARAFAVFLSDKLKPLQKSVGIFPTLDFRNFGSLAVGQTEVPQIWELNPATT